MSHGTPDSRWLSIIVGGLILAAAMNATIINTGGYGSSHALLVMALSAGVFAAFVIGQSWSTAQRAALMIVIALVAGEAYNFFTTGERIIVERVSAAAPLLAKAKARDDAIAHLASIEKAEPETTRLRLAKAALADAKAETESERLKIARQDLKDAKAAVETEAKNVRCGKDCLRKQGLADKAEAELTAALSAAATDRKAGIVAAEAEVRAAVADAAEVHAKVLAEAQAAVEANPLPPSANPMADHIGCAPWALDLFLAFLLSLGANGLAGTLIAHGASGLAVRTGDVTGQSDFALPDNAGPNVVRFFKPDNDRPDRRPGDGLGPKRGGPDRPKKPGPTGGLSKEQAFDDLTRRLTDGRTIPSQDTLASDWNRPKQTVSDWMREWRRIGIVPAATPAGRCKATMPA